MSRRVIYISKSLIGADQNGITAILSTSMDRNAQADVTGMLWADSSNFAQVIEGDADAVGQTMRRISADRRHADIDVLFDRQVLTKQFGDWSMRSAAGDDACLHGTSFMIGFAMSGTTAATKRLYQIVAASDGNGD